MNSSITSTVIRAVIIMLMQILLFSRMDMSIGSFSYIHIVVTPLIVMLLPLRLSQVLVTIIAFVVGIILDFFFNSPGVHAGALVFVAFVRGLIIEGMEPFEGYDKSDSPTIENLGAQWFFIYSSILLFGFFLVYFSLEYFSHVFLSDILLNSIFSFIPSLVAILLYMLIFRPKS